MFKSGPSGGLPRRVRLCMLQGSKAGHFVLYPRIRQRDRARSVRLGYLEIDDEKHHIPVFPAGERAYNCTWVMVRSEAEPATFRLQFFVRSLGCRHRIVGILPEMRSSRSSRFRHSVTSRFGHLLHRQHAVRGSHPALTSSRISQKRATACLVEARHGTLARSARMRPNAGSSQVR